MHQFYEFVASRRSIRKYTKEPIPVTQLRHIIQAGMRAPSAHNAQPWRIFVLQTRKEKKRLATAMGAVFRQDLIADGEEPATIEELVNLSIERFTNAPVLLVACLTMEAMDVYQDDKRRRAEYLMAVQSVAAAVQTMLLSAHAEGLGACWFCAPLFCPNTVQEVLGIPKDVIPQALITLGFADEAPSSPSRRAFDEVVRYIDGKEE
jgi:F420 biosynthesis protein FbiB-like protein